jgi:hypothetical protein
MLQCLLALAMHIHLAQTSPDDPYKDMLQAPSLPPLSPRMTNTFLPKMSDLGMKASWLADEFGVPVRLTKRQRLLIKLERAAGAMLSDLER